MHAAQLDSPAANDLRSPLSPGASTTLSSRTVFQIAALMVLSAAYGCYCRAPLIWDGAYQFDMSLWAQHPYVYKSRFHTFFLWWPMVWASRHTSNIMLLQALFGLPFLLAPLAGFLGAWWMVKRHHPGLMIWAAFGILASPLPGQIFVINDSLFQLHLFWPIFMAMFVPLSAPKVIFLAILAMFEFAHPLGIVLFLGAAIAAAGTAQFDRPRRRTLLIRAGIFLLLAVAATGKVVLNDYIPAWHDEYAKQEATLLQAALRWYASVYGAPLIGLLCLYGAGALALAIRWWHRPAASQIALARRTALFLTVATAVLWFYWAWFFKQWAGAIDYRRWVGPLTAPFFALATAEVCIESRRPPGAQTANTVYPSSFRDQLGLILAVMFTLVLGIQYTSWRMVGDRLLRELDAYPVAVMPDDLPTLHWTWWTPIGHWGSENFVTALQGKRPMKVFLHHDQELNLQLFCGEPPNWQNYLSRPYWPPGPQGWFDFLPLLARWQSQKLAYSSAIAGITFGGAMPLLGPVNLAPAYAQIVPGAQSAYVQAVPPTVSPPY